MYRAPSKRRQLINRVVVYTTMTLATGFLVTLLVFLMLGFRFNRDTSTIEQGGLVQFASRPDNANVSIGNARLGDQTPSKITVNPGSYPVTITKKGYYTWTKNADVHSGQVLWLNYAQLVPEKITTKQLTKIDKLADAKSSPNGDRFAVIKDATKPEITFYDITGDAPKQTSLTIPGSVIPADKTPTYSLGDWGSDSDHLLVTMTYDNVTERLYVNRTDASKTVNISSSYEKDVAQAIFDPRSSDRIIIRTVSGDVRIIDIPNDSVSEIMASSVTSMSTYGNDAIVVVQTVSPDTQSVGYVSFGSKKVRTIKRIQSAEPVLAAIASYFSDPYLAVTVGTRLDTYKIRTLPSSDSDSSISMTSLYTTTLPAAAEFLSIRSGGRFVFTQYGTGVSTYDIELQKQSLTSFTTPVKTELRWIDKYHFYTTNGSHLEVMEFDGSNAHVITPLTTVFDAVQSDDGKYIYSITSVDTGFAIQRSQMILN